MSKNSTFDSDTEANLVERLLLASARQTSDEYKRQLQDDATQDFVGIKPEDRNVTYAYVYSRAKVGINQSDQVNRCLDKAKAYGYSVIAIYKEITVSGTPSFRPKLSQMLADIKSAQVQDRHIKIVVIVDELTRISRDVGTHLTIKRQIECELNCRIIFVRYNSENTPSQRFLKVLYDPFESLAEPFAKVDSKNS